MISQDDVLSYYRAVLPFIEDAFAGIPLVWATYPDPKAAAVFHGPLRDREHQLQTVDVRLGKRVIPYFALRAKTAEWLIEYHHAVEFHSWTPAPEHPCALRYARILLENNDTRDAALTLREFLNEREVRAIPLLDGNGGVALYLPFDDAPGYDDVRRWLHVVSNDAAARRPDLFTTEPNSHGGSRVHIHVSHNAPGLYSALPHSLRGPDGRCAVAPLTWDEMAALPANAVQIEANDALERLHNLGDLFAAQRDAIGKQRFTPLAATLSMSKDDAQPAVPARGHVLHAAFEILSDGRSRSAEELLKEGIARNLLAATTSYRYVYNALVEYINRNVARGRKAAFVQNPDRTFRINEPLDDWPDVSLPAEPPPDDSTKALIARLRATVSGTDPTAWEAGACDAFAHLGFRATHLGGHKAPDGYVDASLGPLGYRVMLECKTGDGIVPHPDVAEAAKWIDAYHGQFNALVGPGFPDETEFHAELLTHRVSAWTIVDLIAALEKRIDPFELRSCFEGGYAADALLDILWERNHGERKRAIYVAEIVAREGWAAQIAAAAQADPADAPHLTVDGAMLLAQSQLTRVGATRACTRAEVERAFEYLTSPILGNAIWLGADRNAIVIKRETI